MRPELEPVLAGLTSALEDEIEAVNRRGRRRVLAFTNGRRQKTSPAGHTYRLSLGRPAPRLDALTATVSAGGIMQTGELLDASGRELVVTVPRTLGDAVSGGTVEIDPSAILEATEVRLTQFATGELDLDEDTLWRLFGATPGGGTSPPEAPDPDAPEPSYPGLDPYQSAAVAAAAGGELTFVWGPPGTGKTRTLGRLATELVAAGRRVLLTAHAHVAVDAAVISALAAGCTAVVRLGAPQLPEVPDHVVVDRLKDAVPTLEFEAGSAGAPGSVLAATLSKIALSDAVLSRRFDHVLVDEASMAPLPQLLLAAGLGAATTCFGDPRQLPPVVTADTPAARVWLHRDVFDASGVGAAIAEGAPDPRLRLLARQYRADPQIAAVTNTFAYGGRLESAPDTGGHAVAEAEPGPGRPVVLWDTAPLAPVAIRPGVSRCNPLSAAFVAQVAALAAVPGARGGGGAPRYAAQARLIPPRRVDLDAAAAVEVATVHRFQGGEREMIVVDLCDGRPHQPPPFLQRDEGVRLLNVAMSRARSKLVVVADSSWLRGGPCARALELVAEHGSHVDASEWPGVEWMSAEEFLQRAPLDVAAARDRVLLRAPRLRVTDLTEALLGALPEPVVVTDTAADPDLADALGALVERRVAERVLVADDVVYTGNTQAPAAAGGRGMARLQGAAFARRLARILTPAGPEDDDE